MADSAVEVFRARTELREAIDEITTVQHRRVEYDDGTSGHFTAPPLLVQVEQEISQQSAKAGSFNARSKPPVWVDAVQLLADIDQHTRSYQGGTRYERVREWSAQVSSGSPGHIADAAEAAVHWRNTVDHLLDPRPKFRLRGQACPQCGFSRVWDRFDEGAGESHARPALEIDTRRGVCTCLQCQAEWEPLGWEQLGQMLQQQQHETLQAQGWDTTVRPRTDAERGLRWHDVRTNSQ